MWLNPMGALFTVNPIVFFLLLGLFYMLLDMCRDILIDVYKALVSTYRDCQQFHLKEGVSSWVWPKFYVTYFLRDWARNMQHRSRNQVPLIYDYGFGKYRSDYVEVLIAAPLALIIVSPVLFTMWLFANWTLGRAAFYFLGLEV